MAFCDGSVQLISFLIDPAVHQSLGNRKDDAPIDFRTWTWAADDSGTECLPLQTYDFAVPPWRTMCPIRSPAVHTLFAWDAKGVYSPRRSS